jgi:hypothetical protein
MLGDICVPVSDRLNGYSVGYFNSFNLMWETFITCGQETQVSDMLMHNKASFTQGHKCYLLYVS